MTNDELTFSFYPVFKASGPVDKQLAAKELTELLADWGPKVETRGAYSVGGFRADSDLMFWWISSSADDLQSMFVELRNTQLGRALEQSHSFMGLVRPAEFAKDHLPAFAQGKPPKKYACVYPFVRTPEWYLLDPKERGALLREHGEAGRQYSDVLANTTSAFGLGDYEWILAFEADGLDRIVELIRHLRGTEARRYTKLETPFVTGIRKEPAEVVADLP